VLFQLPLCSENLSAFNNYFKYGLSLDYNKKK